MKAPRVLALNLAILTAASTLSPSAVADVAAVYHFDEPTGATSAQDAIGNLDGTLVGAAAFVPGGIAGGAIQFTRSGNGHANMGDNFKFPADFSIVYWIKTAPGHAAMSELPIGNHVGGVFNGYLFMLNLNVAGCYGQADKVSFYQAGGCNVDPRSTTSVNDGAWHQIVGVHRAGGLQRIYVDGAPVEDSRNSTNITYASAGRFIVGGYVLGTTPIGHFTGQIDEVQLYPHLLTDLQIDFLFQNPAQSVIGALGDMNCDGVVTVTDISGFVLALTNPAGYEAAFPDCDIMHADSDMSGTVTVGDIGLFVQVLTAG